VDADEELASDMADRWASFSRTSNPNYEGSPKEWLPWWHHPNASRTFRTSSIDGEGGKEDDDGSSTFADFENFWNDFEDQQQEEDSVVNLDYEDELFSDEMMMEEDSSYLRRERYYRQKALVALDLEVADDDVYRTELRRSLHRSGKTLLNSTRASIGGLLLKYGRMSALESIQQQQQHQLQAPRYDPKKVLSMAQEMGTMGTGLLGNGNQRSEFLPEFLDLSWPPEERLVERDCTCDLWDRLRYRY
jgi:hypothetical protein